MYYMCVYILTFVSFFSTVEYEGFCFFVSLFLSSFFRGLGVGMGIVCVFVQEGKYA